MKAAEYPQQSSTRLTMTTVAHPSSVRIAREFVTHHLRCWGIDDEVIDNSGIVTSELVTNAHRIADGLQIWVAVSLNDGAPLVECWDPMDEEMPQVRVAADDDETGRGLHLVSALSSCWGALPDDAGGKTVWAVLA